LALTAFALTVALSGGCSTSDTNGTGGRGPGGTGGGGSAGIGGGGSSGAGGYAGTAIVGPEGGVLHFPNGIVLDFPAGAVSETVEITVDELPTEELDAILEAREYVLSELRTLGGFLIEPHLEFAVPITGTIPIAQPEPYELLWRAEVDFDSGKAWPSETSLEYDPVRGVVEVEIPHTSNAVILGHDGAPSMPAWLRWAFTDAFCSTAELNRGNAQCEALDPLQPGCCLIQPPSDRPPSCSCCRQGAARHQSNAADYSQSRASGDCEIVTDQVLAEYYDCTLANGSPVPVEQHILSAVSPNCSEDMILKVEIEPSPIDMFVCETQQLTATIEGRRPDGTVEIPKQSWPVVWRTSDDRVARFDDPTTGAVYGASEGFTRVFAQTGIDKLPFPARVPLIVRSNVQSLSVDPPAAQVNILDGEVLTATVTKHDGTPLDEDQVTWFSMDESIAYVTQDSGSFTSVRGVAQGCTDVVAGYTYDFCEIVSTVVPVCVDCRRISFSVRPDTIKVIAGAGNTVVAEALDEGNVVDASAVRWESNKVFVASPEQPSGAQARILGIRPGQAVVTATYEDDCQVIRDTVEVEVCPALAIEPSASIISPGDTVELTLQAVDAFGNPVPWTLEDVVWDTSTPGIVSLNTTSVSGRVIVRGSSPGLGYVRAIYEGECGTQTVLAQVQVQEAVLEGDWNVQAVWGEQDCYINGSLDLETTFASDDSLTISVEQSGPSVTAQYEDYPESQPFTGTVYSTLDPLLPYELELSVGSTATADCLELSRSGATLYGQPVCSACAVAECTETEEVSGYVTPGGDAFFGQSEWGLTALSEAGDTLFCEGEAALVACREGGPWVLFVDIPCGSTEEAILLCEDFYGPDWAYADCVPPYGPYPGQLACVYCN
jgi:hypothetical protein